VKFINRLSEKTQAELCARFGPTTAHVRAFCINKQADGAPG